MKTHVTLTTAVCVLTLILSTSVQGVVIPLSTHTSEPTGPNSVPASWLDATMDLSVNQVGEDWELTLAVTNLTPEGDSGFNISELYFNTSAPITKLTLDEVMGVNWTLSLDNPLPIGPFGLFDISLKNVENGPDFDLIDPGETVTFTMNIEGDASSYADTDFYDISEWHETGKYLAFGAAKFKRGPEDLSAYGAYVPEPATILLLGLGMLCLLRKRRS